MYKHVLEKQRELFRLKRMAKSCLFSVKNFEARGYLAYEPECKEFLHILGEIREGSDHPLHEIINPVEATVLYRILDHWLCGEKPSVQDHDRLLSALQEVRDYFTSLMGQLLVHRPAL